jgi:hypothetical protein
MSPFWYTNEWYKYRNGLPSQKKKKKQWLWEEMFESRFPRAGGREEGMVLLLVLR